MTADPRRRLSTVGGNMTDVAAYGTAVTARRA
jgi:hypothetical protein